MICERLLSEQEHALRAEYDVALNRQLAEQYEAFVRFNIDQVRVVQLVAKDACTKVEKKE